MGCCIVHPAEEVGAPMMSSVRPWFAALACPVVVCLALVPSRVESQTPPTQLAEWSKTAAAEYLDGRLTWWMGWQPAERDHDTSCLSCHTSLPYALARPALRAALGEAGPTIPEAMLLGDVGNNRSFDHA